MAGNSESIDGNDTLCPHNLHVSTANVSHLEKVFSNVRQKFRRKPGEQNGRSRCKYVDMGNIYDRHSSSRSSSWKTIIWRIHILPKTQSMRTLKQVFNVTRKLINDHKEIQGISVINWQQQTWQRTTLLTDKAVQLSNAKPTGSVLCLGRISENLVKAWKEKIDWFQNPIHLWRSGSNRWGAVGVLVEIQNMMTEIECELEQFQGRNIFMSKYNDIVWREKGNKKLCIANCLKCTRIC